MSSTVTTPEPDSSCEEEKFLRVTFSPELYLQRQAWVLDILRDRKVTSVLDIGCGEGALLSCLLEPAQTVDSEPSDDDPPLDILPDLHLNDVGALDVCLDSLKVASQHVLSPSRVENPSGKRDPWQHAHFRWESLTVKLWHGSFDSFNPAFAYDARSGTGYQAIVAQEVIEHLMPEHLDNFAPVLMGLYRPQFLLVTTPSFDFNQRFTAPGVEDPRAYLDPTNRTTRRFRHDDHKLEFTRSEFQEYCDQAAREFGYTVTIEHIGLPLDPDPYAHLRDVGAATQCALFVLQADEPSSSQSPSSRVASALVLHSERFFPAHPSPPLSSAEILTLIEARLTLLNEAASELHALWYFADGVSVACAGSLRRLVRAVLSMPDEWELTPSLGALGLNLDSTVRWKAFVPRPNKYDEEGAASGPADAEWETGSAGSWAMSDSDGPAYSDAEELIAADTSDAHQDSEPSAAAASGSGWDSDDLTSHTASCSSWPATALAPAASSGCSTTDWATCDLELEPVRA